MIGKVNVTQQDVEDLIVGDNASEVHSVAGRTGTVVLTKTDVGLANVDNTADANKPVSTAAQTALNLKAPLASPTFTGTVAGITKSMVGLGSVDNTADTAKPVSTAQQTALDLKESLANKGANSGYMGLDSTGRAAQTNLPALALALHLIVGDGSDGNLVYDGSSTILGMAPAASLYTLTRDIYAGNMTVNTGVKIKTAGFRIFVRGKLANAGTIHFNGADASGITPGASFSNQGSLGISAGAGGAGKTATTAAGNGGSGSGGSNVANSAGGNGGDAPSNLGGLGNASAVPAATAGTIRDLGFFNRARLIAAALPNGGGGGGGGGIQLNTGTGTSGSGGGAAGGVAIACLTLDNTNGIICADGGKGSDATVTGNTVAGGGGGGAAGWVWIAAGIVVATGTIRANGGPFGAGAGAGVGVAQAGTTGTVVTIFPTGL
jgi:hypothetical protein